MLTKHGSENLVAILIGTDEAGYGPFLGPLVITATRWQCPQADADIYQLLSDVVTDSPKVSKQASGQKKILVADSKVACRSGAIGNLELSVLTLLNVAYGKTPQTLVELVSLVMPDVTADFMEANFWLRDTNVALPLVPANGTDGKVAELSDCFGKTCDKKQVKLSGIVSAILLPPEFNRGVAMCGNKAHLLSSSTLKLVSDLMQGSCEETLIECDKHGGRNYYGPIINENLTDQTIKTLIESPGQSAYRWAQSGREVEIRFTAKGEDQLPVALASMVSKYVREVFMVAWNEFWNELVPGIKPTKGYPQDAKRFLSEIQEVAESKDYSKDDFWRSC